MIKKKKSNKKDSGVLIKNIAIIVVAILVLGALFSLAENRNNEKEDVSISQLIKDIKEDKITEITVKGEALEYVTLDGGTFLTKKEPGESLSTLTSNYDINPEKLESIDLKIKTNEGIGYWLLNILPILLPIVFILLFFWLISRQVQGAGGKAMNFGQSNIKDQNEKGNKRKKITFKDVAGVKEAKEELEEVVEFLRNPKKFSEVGAKIPRGVLLVGGAGTGKTLLAKAVSGEAGVPFFIVSGSEFVEMFVGVGASRVRSLFDNAKKNAPCIIFIDEIDAIGRQRGAGLGGSHDEREQTLNQILVEMDGFETNQGVIVLAATNRPDVLDSALLRPGRFDRRVVVDMPDLEDRTEILKVHSFDKKFTEEVSFRKVAERTPGFSGADLANLLNESAIKTARENRKEITLQDIFDSIEKVILGPERKSRIISEREKKITAYHEVGHAIVAHSLPNTDPVQKVSIISRGSAGGYTLTMPEKDVHMHSKSYFIEQMSVLLAGHAIEKEIFGEVTTGATSDLQKTTKIAHDLITRYGMSEKMGPRTFGEHDDLIFLGREISEQKDYSENTAEMIDKEMSEMISESYRKTEDVIRDKKEVIEELVNVLLEKETLEKIEFEKIAGEKTKK
jgi:cell division protease FtsH